MPNRREHFIPIAKHELAEFLASSLTADERALFQTFSRVLDATLHLRQRPHFEELKQLYEPFDPDLDKLTLRETSEEQRDDIAPQVFTRVVELLTQANFRRLAKEDLDQAVGAASDWGVRLNVDFNVFQRLEVFARGDKVTQRSRRRLGNFYRHETVDVPMYERLVVIFRLRDHKRLDDRCDTNSISIKVFKNIPKKDLDMLLPGTQVCMSLFDRGKILLPTLSGVLLTLLKVMKGAVVLAFAGVYGLLAFLGLVGGTVGYGVKSFFGYLRTKDKYQLNLTRSLYYQNLDNNAGVISRLFDEAEEQEFREALLGYFVLWVASDPEGWTEQQIDTRAEQLLREATSTDIDFELHDALAKLRRLGLVRHQSDGRVSAEPIQQSIARLKKLSSDSLDQIELEPAIIPAARFNEVRPSNGDMTDCA